MTKEEIGKIIDSKKFSKTIRCYEDDKLSGFIKEIYLDGMYEGYKLAIFRLKLLGRMPADAADEYFKEHMEDVRSILKLCEQYEACQRQD